MAPSRQPSMTLSWRKKAAFGLLVTVVFFLAVECLLAALDVQPTLADRDPYVGFESSIPLFVEAGDDHDSLMRTAPNKLKFFNPQQFTRQKPADTIRIFCLGGSTTFGRPYDDTTSFVAWLRQLLPIADNDQKWEVINAGGISYASYRVASLLEELSAYSPDLFVVYTGHNEFLEERTYRDLQSQPSSVQRIGALLHGTRTYSLAHSLLSAEPPSVSSGSILPAEVDAILDHSVGPDSYHRDEQLRVDVGKHFEFNLARMVETARSVGAEILFVTPASNLKDFSPFKSQHRGDLDSGDRERWQELLVEAKVLAREGKTQLALDRLQQAAEIDDRPAELHFRIGRALLAEERFPEARLAFQRAVDEDVCPLRALSDFQRTVERVAVAQRVPLVDFDSILKHDCLHRYGHDSPGREYFLDHVHPTIASHRLLATAIVEAMIQRGIVHPNLTWSDQAVALATERIVPRINPELQSRALTNLAQVLSWAGKQAEAGPLAVQATRLRSSNGLPVDPESMFYAAVHYAVAGADEQAIELFRRVVEQEPDNSEAHWRLATLLFDQMQYEESEHHFREAIKLNPGDSITHQMLGLILLKSSRYREALESFRRAEELNPGDPGLRENIALALDKLGEQTGEGGSQAAD